MINKRYFSHPAISCLLLGIASFLLVLGLQSLNILQVLELRSFDTFLAKRPAQPIDHRITIIGETEPDIRRFGHPLSDQVFADALQKAEEAGARVIGVDKYRDIPTPPGTDNLSQVLTKYDNIIWIFFGGDKKQNYIAAPPALDGNMARTGFNNILQDPDGVARRGMLFSDINGESYYSFPLLLSLYYLANEQIAAQLDGQTLTIGNVRVPQIDTNFGGYRQADTGGYQVMLDYPALKETFSTFTLSDLLDDKIPKEALKDKVVLFGAMAPSLQDYWLLPGEITRFGIEYHAYFISQILHIGTQQQHPMHAVSDKIEYAWLIFWCLVGTFTGLLRGGLRFFALITVEFIVLLGSYLVLLSQGEWLPFVSPLLGWICAFFSSIFYFFTQSRAERGQLMKLFESQVSPELASHLWDVREQFFSKEGILPDTLTATVLFTDLTSFTTISEHMAPELLVTWLNEYMEEMSQLVMAHGGMINKYIGDAIMAIFGVPVKRETEEEIARDAQHAVACAIEFGHKLTELNQKWAAQGLPTVTMRTGIYTGTMVAGSIGSKKRMEYTVIGDTVNTASRLESFDKTVAAPTLENPCRILIGTLTHHYVNDQFHTQIVGECLVKGKTDALTIYQVMGVK
ncbi:MAG TPA: adenylate/guanylate cyclase domain-containing protein [Methylococcaceae bacterium]|nr:adenylate/guanylate cyclase domain-containing protein [Methylococcaceae bacterium]